ncbi:ABC transporter family substrate-binding protein [Haematomicrobium sanguinis]|uniref:ABC transporter family substrate-binding protein n=1 Tax=Haematomicrobium sanguinis TaxID=479106 RepID=UPI00047CD36D|nr:ABC transporter family substrate-binding protein [Haematomicrobium sanguinis]
MRSRRISKVAAIAAIAGLALSACAANTGTTQESGGTGEAKKGGGVTVAEVNAFSSFNDQTGKGNVDINGKVAYITRTLGFNYVNNDLKIVNNDKFGKIEKTSDDPLTVKYTINEGVKWSDGTPVEADDMVLMWAVGSGYFNDAKYDDAGEVSSGTSYFDYAGSTEGLSLTDKPVIGDDNRSITLTYSEPFADWELQLGSGGWGMPSQVVAQKAGLEDNKALTKLIMDTPKGDPENPVENPQLKKVADFWNTGFDTKSLPSDPSLYLSNGPFKVKSMTADQNMVLERNPDYTWGEVPNLDEITIRYIGDASAQIQALKNGEVDIIAPQASADTISLLKGLEGQGVTMDTGPQLSYDHLDLNFTGVFEDLAVRQAFMKTIPRQQILDSIIKPLDPNATVLNSTQFVNGEQGYDEVIKMNGSDQYNEVDIEGAKQLLAGKTPEVRIMYNKDNPNRLNAYTLIAASAAQAGFKIVDGGLGASDWGDALGTGTYDATIFGWISSGVGNGSLSQIWGAGQASNFNRYNNAEVTKLGTDVLQSLDEQERIQMRQQADKLIWADAYGPPLFQSVAVDAYGPNVTGIKFMPNQTGVWWNFWEWAAA